MTRTPRSAAFKKKVAIEALREDNTLEAIVRKYGVHPVQVGKWKKALLDGAEAVFERKTDRSRYEAGKEALERKGHWSNVLREKRKPQRLC